MCIIENIFYDGVNMETVKFSSILEFIEEDATASVSLNPEFQWAKIVVTDDQPNLNRMRIPKEEFSNIIKTGIGAPIKMDNGNITSHKESMGKPIGVIMQLMEEANKIIAMAALWKKERPEDIDKLKKMYLDNNPPQVSWEVGYSDFEEKEGIKSLFGTILNGLCVVLTPAYGGRTPFIAMSSDNMEEDSKMEITVETLQARVLELEALSQTLKDDLAQRITEIEQRDAELASLREYKASIESKEAEERKIAEIKQKFTSSGIVKDESYFTEKRNELLQMADSTLDFVIQELVALASVSTASASKTTIPNIISNNQTDLGNPKNLAKALKELSTKSK